MVYSADEHSCPELAAGFRHLRDGEWDAAAKALRAANRREPGRVAVVRALATALLQLGDEAAARRALREFTIHSPMCAEGWRLAAQLEWKLGRCDDAMAVLARGLERLPNSTALHRQTALFWGARGRLEDSARHAERAGARREESATPDCLDRLAADSKLLGSVLDLSVEESDVEMLRVVEVKLAALLEAQPHHADRQLALARLRVKIGALPEALACIQRALAANPQYVEAQRLRATILGKMEG